MTDTLQKLAAIIEERKSAAPDSSYVAQLHHKGLEKILAKVAEEAEETMEAAREAELNGDLDHVIYETADLWFTRWSCWQSLKPDPTPSWQNLKDDSASAVWTKKHHVNRVKPS